MKESVFITGAGAGIGRDTARLFAARTQGRLRLLHNNAGILKVGRFEEINMASHRSIVEINVIGPMTETLQARHPRLHRPLSAQFRILWPLTRSAPSALIRAVIRRLWK